MGYYLGLDVSLKSTHICVLDGERRVVWRGVSDTQIAMIAGHSCMWGAVSSSGLRGVPCRLALSRSQRSWSSHGLHGCAPGFGCAEGSGGEDGQGGCSCASGDVGELLRRSHRAGSVQRIESGSDAINSSSWTPPTPCLASKPPPNNYARIMLQIYATKKPFKQAVRGLSLRSPRRRERPLFAQSGQKPGA